jgi:hypothetical protein
MEVLSRLAGLLGADLLDVLQRAGYLQRADRLAQRKDARPGQAEYLVDECLFAFRRLSRRDRRWVIAQLKARLGAAGESGPPRGEQDQRPEGAP